MKRKESIITCPVCKSTLYNKGCFSICDNNHSFDHAKEGYINLLLSNKKHSKNPGDSSEMIMARHNFLESGAYEQILPLLVSPINNLKSSFSNLKESFHILDSGCGEGYFSRSISKEIGCSPELYWYGIDISKPAIKKAAKCDKNSEWLIANGMVDLPFSDNSMDIILSILAPRNIEEFNRILVNDGSVIVGIPGEFHLMELRNLLMKDIVTFSDKSENEIAKFASKFKLEYSNDVKYQITLSNEELSQLVQMTPMYWKSTPASLKEALSRNNLTITVHFSILQFSKK